MSINLGSNPFGLYLGSSKIGEAYIGSTKIYSSGPVVLPDKTLRFKFNNTSYTPTVGSISSNTSSYGTWTAVNASQGIWDWHYDSTSWNGYQTRILNLNSELLGGSCSILDGNLTGVTDVTGLFATSDLVTNKNDGLVEILDLKNTSSLTNTSYMFQNCSSLASIPLFDISSSRNTSYMFKNCEVLETIPDFTFDNSRLADVSQMFRNCYKINNAKSLFDKLVLTKAAGSGRDLYIGCFSGAGSSSDNDQRSLIPSRFGGTKALSNSYYSNAEMTSTSKTITSTIHPGAEINIKLDYTTGTTTTTLGFTVTNTTSSGGYVIPTTSSKYYSETGTRYITKTISYDFGAAYSTTNTVSIVLNSGKSSGTYYTVTIKNCSY